MPHYRPMHQGPHQLPLDLGIALRFSNQLPEALAYLFDGSYFRLLHLPQRQPFGQLQPLPLQLLDPLSARSQICAQLLARNLAGVKPKLGVKSLGSKLLVLGNRCGQFSP